MGNIIRCPNCGQGYRSNQELTAQGGRVRSLGFSLMGVCGCGCHLGSVASIWRKVDDDKNTISRSRAAQPRGN